MINPDILIAIGRIVFGLFFIVAAYRNFARLKNWTTTKTNYGFALPAPMLVAGFALQVVAGLALVLGFYVIWASIALIVFLIVATPLYHNPFMFKPEERGLHIYLNLVNITLVAGFLQIIGNAL